MRWRKGLLLVFFPLLASGFAPEAAAHGLYQTEADGYRVFVFLNPLDPVAGEETQVIFYIQDKATGGYLKGLKPTVEIEHMMGPIRHRMMVEAKPWEKLYYTFNFTFTDAGFNPISLAFKVNGETPKAEVSVHVLPSLEKPTAMMSGMPDWLFLASSGATVLVTFFVVEVFGKGVPGSGYRAHDLLGIELVRNLVKRRHFQSIFKVPSVLVFLLIIVTGLFGVEAGFRNFAPIMTWVIWWVLLIFLALFLGKIFCLMCPIRAIGEGVQRLVFRGATMAPRVLSREWPRKFKNVLIAASLLLLLTWLELAYGITRDPLVTAYLAIFMVLLAVGTMLLFRRSYFCRYLCPIGLMTGIYSYFAPVELRAKDGRVCAACRTKDCLKGNANGYGCPTYQYLGAMKESYDCVLCTECVRTCPEDNVALNIRPFARDLIHSFTPRVYLGTAMVLLLALTSFHGVSMIPLWSQIVNATAEWLGYLGSFTLWMITFLGLLLAVVAAFVTLSKFASGSPHIKLGRLFSGYAYSLIPIALFYHLAHNVGHFTVESELLTPVVSDPFGWGWDLFGTAGVIPGVLLPMTTTWYIQALLIVVGHIIAVYVAWVISQRLHGDRRQAFRAHIPITALMVFYTMFSLWLTAQPMIMRTGM